MTPYIPWILLVIGGCILTVGDFIMKKWVESNYQPYFIAGLAVYMISNVMLAFSYRYENIAVASVAIIIFNVISLTLISWFYFGEALNLFQLLGISLGIAAIVLFYLA